ncbi:MAG TPA: tetratricopeptide repeat protein [Alphaproteobacteria bacterium]|nr:tetratricopeptide repeat protein [Alphaproteobacteria bacterium]
MVDIFSEVDEDVRRDRAIQLWKRYGNYVAGLAVLVVVATGAYVGWRDWDRKQAEAGAMRFQAANELEAAGKLDEAAAAYAVIASEGRAGYAALARLRAAALKAKLGDAAGAAAAYRAIAAEEHMAPELRDVATLLAGLHDIDSSDPARLEQQLTALSVANSPWRHSALELAAIAAARAGDAAKAREYYTRIVDDPTAPPGLRARASEMLAALAG